MSEKRLRAYLFSFVTLVTWVIYFRTTAPTVVFWDVGEFLATSVILGVPHPPGTPLYVIMGKFMTLLPLPFSFLYRLLTGRDAVEPVLRITFIAITSGALSAGFVYLLTVKVISLWGGARVPRYFGHLAGVFGAFIGAFAHTVWFNAIEAETYAPSTFVMFFVTWLMWLWWERRDESGAVRYLLFVIYVVVLSSGIHLLSLIILPALFLFVLFVRPEQSWIFVLSFIFPFTFFAGSIYVWMLVLLPIFFLLMWLVERSWVGGLELVGVSLAALGVRLALEFSYRSVSKVPMSVFLGMFVLVFVGYMLYLGRKGLLDFNSLWLWLMVLGGGVFLYGLMGGGLLYSSVGVLVSVLGFYLQSRLYRDWRGLAILLVLLAISVELYLMVRAYHSPRINESDPRTWGAFMDVLMRRQYEPARLFPRRIPFLNQLRLYWLYFSWQYREVLIPVVLLGLFGLITHLVSERRSFLLVGGGFLVASLGLIIYLNLKDSPTHPIDPLGTVREVRDRDYFFAPSFQYFGLYAGLGLYELMRLVVENLRVRVLGLLVGLVLSVVMVVGQVVVFYPRLDRSRNYIAEDYAYNLLISPQGRSVLFTNGDNDTFPLWFDQEVLNVRKDVIIANLSIMRTNWYCKQLKSWGAPISFTYEELDSLPGGIVVGGKTFLIRDIVLRDMIATSFGYHPEEFVNIKGVKVPAIYFQSMERFMEEVIAKGSPTFNIYFAVTVDPKIFKGWEEHMLLEGYAWKIVPEKVGIKDVPGVNLDLTETLLTGNLPFVEFVKEVKEDGLLPDSSLFRYRGMFDKKVYKDLTHSKVLWKLAFVSKADGLFRQKEGNQEKAAKMYAISSEFLMQLNEPFIEKFINQMLQDAAGAALLWKYSGKYQDAIYILEEVLHYKREPILLELGLNYLAIGDTTTAISKFEEARMIDPRFVNYRLLADLYLSRGERERAIEALKMALQVNPKDSLARKKLVELGVKLPE
jgi:hypothetical protein